MRHACPRTLHRPATKEGLLLLEACLAPGVWQRAGMAASLTGLDTAGLMARLPPALRDCEAVRSLIPAIETGAMQGEARLRAKGDDGADHMGDVE